MTDVLSNPSTDARISDDTVEILRRQNEIDRLLLAKQKECGIAFYRPHWFQHLFHTAPTKRRGLFAGNRLGKSAGHCAETVAWMLNERPWYKVPFDILGVDHVDGKGRKTVVKHHHDGHPTHPFVTSGIPPYPTKQVIVCTNWDKVHKVWTSQEADRPGKIWQYLPRGFVKKTIRNHEGVIDEIYGTNGSFLSFVSVDAFKRNKLTAESEDWDRVGFDEPGPELLWKGLSRGLVDRMGQGDFTLTSLEEIWIYDYFNKAEISESKQVNRSAFTATIWDNPYLSDASIALFEVDLSDEEKDCRFRGIPLELSGLIYKEFRRDRHILTTLPEGWHDWHLPANGCDASGRTITDSHGNPDLRAPRTLLYARIDTHPVKPNAVMFAAVGPSEIPIVCHEIYKPLDADEIAREINEYVKSTRCYLAGIKVEPAAWQKDPATRRVSIAHRFAAAGLFIRPAAKDLAGGIPIVKAALKRTNPPGVLFTPNCRRTFWEFSRYRYNPETGNPVDEEDHMMENLYRLLIDRLPYFDPDRASGEPIPDAPFEPANLSNDLD